MALDQQFEDKEMSFLDHIDELRKHIMRAVIAVVVMGILCFVFKDILFDVIIFGPSKADFITYRAICDLSHRLYNDSRICIEKLDFTIFNRTVTGQFTMHFFASFIAGLILSFPYILWEFWRFIRPALSQNERSYAAGLVGWGTLLFLSGIGFGYFILTPISLNFLGNYQVSNMVNNDFSLESYINFVTLLTLATGLIFELPMLIYFLAKIGIVSSAFLKKYRRYAIVIILIIAAIITPPDVTSQIIMTIPLLILYEVGIVITKRIEKKKAVEAEA